jgi:hypothetical protein
MAMLRALPREVYPDFVLTLMRQKNLTRANVEAVFKVEQTECNAHRGPLLSPFGNAALCTTVSLSRQPGVKCGFLLPYELVHKHKPSYLPVRMFGCCAWVHIQCKE